MPSKINVAAVKMDAAPAPKDQRLERAEALIVEAATSGAQLIVLPEVFNTGYEYHENNFNLPEPIEGETVAWMQRLAQQYNVHIAGSLLLVDGKDIFNSQILVAPDGRRWRYDKNYPWAFERAYFRDGSDIMVANTDLGKLGMMVCWDYAHAELWQRYAGQVDAMVITSSPPKFDRFTMMMPDGSKVDARALGPIINKAYYGKDHPFGADMDAQAGWLGVPMVNTTGSGTFRSTMPNARVALLAYTLLRPDLWRHLPNAHDVELVAGYYEETKIVDASGQVIARVNEPEGFVMQEITLADTTPAAPTTPQPDIPYAASTYFFTDVFGPAQMEKVYREGVRRQWGKRMAPFQQSYRWHIIIGLGLLGLLAALLRFVGRLTAGKDNA
jgi:hypothetical protein